MKKHLVRLAIFSCAIVVCLTFAVQKISAAESQQGFLNDVTSALHMEINKDSAITGKDRRNSGEKIYDKVPPSSRIHIPLSEGLKLFYDRQALSNYYQKRSDNKSQSLFGVSFCF